MDLTSMASSLFFLSRRSFGRVCNLGSIDWLSRPTDVWFLRVILIYAWFMFVFIHFSGEIGYVVFHQIHKWILDPKDLHPTENSNYNLFKLLHLLGAALSSLHGITTLTFCDNSMEEELLIPTYRQGHWGTEMGLQPQLASGRVQIQTVECLSLHF